METVINKEPTDFADVYARTTQDTHDIFVKASEKLAEILQDADKE